MVRARVLVASEPRDFLDSRAAPDGKSPEAAPQIVERGEPRTRIRRWQQSALDHRCEPEERHLVPDTQDAVGSNQEAHDEV